MYDSGPSDKELAAIGLKREDVTNNEVIDVYPENLLPMQVFIDCVRQWRIGMSGATGLDYAALPFLFDLHSIKKKKQKDVFECLRIMEDEALAKMNDKSE